MTTIYASICIDEDGNPYVVIDDPRPDRGQTAARLTGTTWSR